MNKIIVTVHLYYWEAHKIRTEASKLDLGAVEEGRLVQWVLVSFTTHGRLCTCAPWHQNEPWNDDSWQGKCD